MVQINASVTMLDPDQPAADGINSRLQLMSASLHKLCAHLKEASMPIQSIEIICVPCLKCDGLEQKIRGMVDNIGVLSKIKISYEFKHTKKLDTISQYALTPA